MGWKATLSLPLARWAVKKLRRSVAHPVQAQRAVLQGLLRRGSRTAFGADHGLKEGMSVAEFQRAVPVRDYEGLRGYMDRAVKGEENVVWPGKPLLLLQDQRDHVWGQIHPADQGQHAQPHRKCPKRAVGTHCRHRRCLICGRQNDLSSRQSGIAKTAGGVHLGRIERHRCAPRAIVLAGQPLALVGNQLHRGLGDEGGCGGSRDMHRRFATRQWNPVVGADVFRAFAGTHGQATPCKRSFPTCRCLCMEGSRLDLTRRAFDNCWDLTLRGWNCTRRRRGSWPTKTHLRWKACCSM